MSNLAHKKKAELLERRPIIINNRKKIVITKNREVFLKNMSMANRKTVEPVIKEDVIYESVKGDFMGNTHLKLLNRRNNLTNCIRTVAVYKCTDSTVEKTSDNLSNLIGAKNYGTVLSALCSVIDLELKVRSILALLTLSKNTSESSCQTENLNMNVDLCSTENKVKQRKRIKRQPLTPYVVKNDIPGGKPIKKCIINPVNEKKMELKPPVNDAVVKKDSLDSKRNDILDISDMLGEDSIISNISGRSISLSCTSIPDMVEYNAQELLDSIDSKIIQPKEFVVNETIIETFDGSRVCIPIKPEDEFHIVTPDILKHVTNEEKKRLLWHQAVIDFMYCQMRNKDGNLPIHVAVLHDDVDLVRRQCLMLKLKNESVDVPVNENLSSLQLSLLNNSSPACTSMLLQHGADPLQTDSEDRTILHIAAGCTWQHLKHILDYCRRNAKIILQQNELWKEGFDSKNDDELAEQLLWYMSTRTDNEGYTPLMCASKLGNWQQTGLLVRAAPCVVNSVTPTTGDTALYLAVKAACLDAVARTNRSKISEEFMKTIEVLVENGADPFIDNDSGIDVNMLLQEFNSDDLSMLIVNKLASVKYFDGSMPSGSKNYDSLMLLKDKQGNVTIDNIKTRPIRQVVKPEKCTGVTSSSGISDAIKTEILDKDVTALPSVMDKVKKELHSPDSKIKILQNVSIATNGNETGKLEIPKNVVNVASKIIKHSPSKIIINKTNTLEMSQENGQSTQHGSAQYFVSKQKAETPIKIVLSKSGAKTNTMQIDCTANVASTRKRKCTVPNSLFADMVKKKLTSLEKN